MLSCEGWTVVEMGSGGMPSALAGMILADNGATVVKVEPPEGDRLRASGSAGHHIWNRNKRSVIADLRTQNGRAIARQLTSEANIVIEAFAAGRADEWEIGYTEISRSNPDVVYCSIKGFGSTGEYAHLKGYEGCVAAKAGLYSQGWYGFRGGPIFANQPIASFGAAMHATTGILSAMFVREATGQGQWLETTLLQGLVPLDPIGTAQWQLKARAGEQGGGTMEFARATRYFMTFVSKDGKFVSFCDTVPRQARALSRALGVGWTTDDPRFSRQAVFNRAEDAQEWEEILRAAFRTRTYEEWKPLLERDPEIAFELNRSAEDGLTHPQVQYNGDAVILQSEACGPISQVGPLAHFGRSPSKIETTAPDLGAGLQVPFKRELAKASRTVLPPHPLSGVTIVELGYFYATPYALTVAAALGARVIKIEPLDGDPMRDMAGSPEVAGVKVMAGKESIAVDLGSERGRSIVRALVDRADVFVTGFRSHVRNVGVWISSSWLGNVPTLSTCRARGTETTVRTPAVR